jgi:hypothetical protein
MKMINEGLLQIRRSVDVIVVLMEQLGVAKVEQVSGQVG